MLGVPNDRVVFDADVSVFVGNRPLVQGIRLSMTDGEVVAFLGPSGAGKTTFLRAIAGIRPLGQRSLACVNWRVRPRRLAMSFQPPVLLPWLTVLQNIGYESGLLEPSSMELTRQVALQLLKDLEIDHARDVYPSVLSQGMAQRVQLGKALCLRAPLVLLDEPLASLDAATRRRVAPRIAAFLRRHRMAAIWVTHDLEEANTVSDRLVEVVGLPLTFVSESRPKDPRTQEPYLQADSSKAPAIEFIEPRGLRTTGLAMTVAVVTGTGLLWECMSRWSGKFHFAFSSPTDVARYLTKSLRTGELLVHALYTVGESGIGFCIASVLAGLGGLTWVSSRRIASFMSPLTRVFAGVPLFVFGPAFIIWFGVGLRMKMAVAIATALPAMTLSFYETFKAILGDYYLYLQAQGGSRLRLLVYYLLPASLDKILSPLKAGFLSALTGAFMGEFIAAEKGLGYLMLLTGSRYRMDGMLAALVMYLAIAAIATFMISSLLWFRHKLVAFTGKET